MYYIKRILDPGIFQGLNKKHHYFEGWYFKLIDREKEHALVIIPGISIGRDKFDSQAFIQVLYDNSRAGYYRFGLKDFSFSEAKFYIKLAGNVFSRDGIRLELGSGHSLVKGNLEFYNILELPKTIYTPGIMGPFSYIPCLECYHGIINIRHEIMGSLNLFGKTVDFTGGYGYIEKDWGRSFPKRWIWMQSNHFGRDDVTFVFSAADIPILGTSFPGFLSILRLKEQIHVFATYTGAVIRKLKYRDGYIQIRIEDRRYSLDILAGKTGGEILKAPINGKMDRKIRESINSRVKVRLMDKREGLIYQGIGTNTGVEIVP